MILLLNKNKENALQISLHFFVIKMLNLVVKL
ncbi:protein of unknown function [Legionella fallonii LLAP-10]|uniref:Uncharacterized protein n=1 Tax=Legionella fallonii LLAP-10 TaxID=1212491 RepID=A0A098GC18_9GAMM|nr:protein of unknown function [Legionella fallonii LLAP-10]